MGFRHPHQRFAQRVGFRGVDRHADAAAADIERLHVVEAPLAADHDRQPRVECRRFATARGPCRCGRCCRAVRRLRSIASVTVGGVRRLGIGAVGILQAAIDAFGPDRPGRGLREAAQHLGLLQQRPVPEIGLGQFPPHAGQFANPYNGLAADGAADGFDGVSVRRGQVKQEPFAALAQNVDRAIHLLRRRRRQPGSERQDALRRFLGGERGDVAADLRPILARGPGDQDLGLGKQQRAVAVGFALQALDFAAQAGLVPCRAQARSHQEDGGDDRKAEQRQRCRQRRELLMVHADEAYQRA